MSWRDRTHLLTKEQREAGLMLWWTHYLHVVDGEQKNGVAVLCRDLSEREPLLEKHLEGKQ